MTVNSLSFLLFFIAVACIYYLPFLRKYQWVILLISSYCFYLSFGLKSIIYISITSITTYVATKRLNFLLEKQKNFVNNAETSRTEIKEYKEKNKIKRNHIVLLHVLCNVGILIVLKYSNFFILNANKILPEGIQLTTLKFLVPLGISYYTLQSIGYVVDVSKGKADYEPNLAKTSLFITYFPQITQGPIGRFDQLGNQLFSSHAFSYKNLSYGCQRLLWGYFKKTVIADRMKPTVTMIFSHYEDYSGMTLFLGCIYLSIQAYADFSGYMDIIAGFSEILGIKVSENFKRPFFSKSLAEYWRRWHITLGGWFRDYMFYPLSLSKNAVKLGRFGKKHFSMRFAKLLPSIYALAIVWFSTGLWHAASWRYILWGICNGIILISSTFFASEYQSIRKKLKINEESKIWHLFQMLRTFLIISLLKVFPGAESTKASLQILKDIFIRFNPSLGRAAWFPGLTGNQIVYIVFGLALFFVVSFIQEKTPFRDFLSKRPFVVRWILYVIVLCSILCFGVLVTDVAGGFEYAQY